MLKASCKKITRVSMLKYVRWNVQVQKWHLCLVEFYRI